MQSDCGGIGKYAMVRSRMPIHRAVVYVLRQAERRARRAGGEEICARCREGDGSECVHIGSDGESERGSEEVGNDR